MQTVAPPAPAPDEFVYIITQFPLKFAPYDPTNANAGIEPETSQARLRRHTKDVQDYAEQFPEAAVDDLLESGEQFGEAVVCFYVHARERRARHDRLEAVLTNKKEDKRPKLKVQK